MGRSSLLARLLASFGALALIAGLVGSVGMWAFSRVNAAFQVAVHQSLPAVTHLVEADRDMQQAVVAERSLMFMKLDAPPAREQIKSHRDHLVKVVERWKRYTAIPASDEERERWSAFEAARSEWAAASHDVLEVLAQDSPGARRDAVDLSLGEAAAKFDKARALLNELIETRLGLVRAHAHREGAAAARLAWWIIASVVGAFTLAGVLAFRFARWVARPLRQAVALLKDIAEGAGDLTKRLTLGSSDEVGELARWFNLFMDRLHEIIGQVRATAVHVASASQQLSEATTHLSTGAQQHASSLEETAASLKEITGTVRQNADNASQANQLAGSSRDTAEKGGQVVTAAVVAMGEINRSSKKIGDIITAIDAIAFQTNLLALNAAVEAARAGEQGRGFAVVAAEVRNLAQRSAEAAKEIKGLIKDSVEKVEGGSELVNRSGQTLAEIVGSVKRVTDIIAEIAVASREQAQGIDQVNRAVAQMDQVVQANAAHTEELTTTAQVLAGQASELTTLVGRFRLADAERPEPVGRSHSTPVAGSVPRPRRNHPGANGRWVGVGSGNGFASSGDEDF